MASLIYIADPMCSWCYGFGPQLSALLEAMPQLPLEIVVGGLRAYNTQPMDDRLRQTLLAHWRHVEERTGLPFFHEGLSREGFVYDTEPACRAVVAARMLVPGAALAVFRAIQHAFYAQGQDVTQGKVLAEVASHASALARFPIAAEEFHAVWSARDTIAATRADFEQAQRWGVRGFPTLALAHRGKLRLVANGYATAEIMAATLRELLDSERGTEPGE